jgi:hypothetical protein
MQMILWHDAANGRPMKWSVPMRGAAGGVDIASQMKQTLSQAQDDEDNGGN